MKIKEGPYCNHVLDFSDEIIPLDEIRRQVAEAIVNDREGKLKQVLIELGWSPQNTDDDVIQVAAGYLAAKDVRIAALEEALKPFADYADHIGISPDNLIITQGSLLAKKQLTMADCRRAREELERK
jgi:hypothetical protein